MSSERSRHAHQVALSVCDQCRNGAQVADIGRPRQELNDRRLTLCEGSALSERDLVRTRAEAASAVLLLADRFSPSVHQEDLSIQFQVCAPHTKRRCSIEVCIVSTLSLCGKQATST